MVKDFVAAGEIQCAAFCIWQRSLPLVFNPIIKEFYVKLCERGKVRKVAIIAYARLLKKTEQIFSYKIKKYGIEPSRFKD